VSEKRAEIIDAALSAMGEEGYDSLTVGAVAERVDMTDAGVHYYFETREDLLAAVGEHLEAQTDAVASEFEGPPGDRLAAYLRTQFEVLSTARDRTPATIQLRAAAASGNERLDAALAGVESRLRAFVVEAIREGIEDGTFTAVDPEETAALIHATLQAAELRADRGDGVADIANGLRARVLTDLYVEDPPEIVPDNR
jgi:AcrR family transcriptional regulator